MKKLKINISLDLLFFFTISFFILFYFLRYKLFNFAISLTLSIIFSILLTTLFLAILINKDNKLIKSQNTKNNLNNFYTYLCLLKSSDVVNLICSLCKASGKEYNIENDIIYLANDTIIVSNFTFSDISKDYIINMHKTYKKSIILFCNSISQDATTLINTYKLNIHPITSNELYYILEKYNLLPKIKNPITKVPLKEKVKGIFNRKKCKFFILSGLTILGLSSFVGYPLFYIISGTILLLTGLYLYFFAPKSSKTTLFF